MKIKRRHQNKLTIDLLPPFGKPEITLFGSVALYGGLIAVLAAVLTWFVWENDE